MLEIINLKKDIEQAKDKLEEMESEWGTHSKSHKGVFCASFEIAFNELQNEISQMEIELLKLEAEGEKNHSDRQQIDCISF